jgi:hypothetical protein
MSYPQHQYGGDFGDFGAPQQQPPSSLHQQQQQYNQYSAPAASLGGFPQPSFPSHHSTLSLGGTEAGNVCLSIYSLSIH